MKKISISMHEVYSETGVRSLPSLELSPVRSPLVLAKQGLGKRKEIEGKFGSLFLTKVAKKIID